MKSLPILEFIPLLKETVWGGDLLEKKLHKKYSGDSPVGESWEIVDLPQEQSIVAPDYNSQLAGVSLEQLLKKYPEEILEKKELALGRFPLLVKFIDAQKTLSVQVHPDSKACAQLGKGARPKTEAWYVIDRVKGASLYVGLKSGVTKDGFALALKEKNVQKLLNKIEVNPGDFIFLPSGTVHAIGAGILLAEVQQSSDTTYRVFDWNRLGLDGRPRQLHIENALESINFSFSGAPLSTPPSSGRRGVSCSDFIMELVKTDSEQKTRLGSDGPLILMGVAKEGKAKVKAEGSLASISKGKTLFVPASISRNILIYGNGSLEILAISI